MNTNQDYSKAHVLLSLMSDSQITEVVDLCRTYGNQVISEIRRAKKSAFFPSPILGELDNPRCTPADLNAMLHGITLIFFKSMSQDWSEGEYVDLLTSALGMSEEQATKIAAAIDTEDQFSWKKADWGDRFTKVYNMLVPKFTGLEAEYDSAGMDTDLPWEMMKLGYAMQEFLKSMSFSKSRLLSAIKPAELASTGDILASRNAINVLKALPHAAAFMNDATYGDIFKNIVDGLKASSAVLPLPNLLNNLTQAASIYYDTKQNLQNQQRASANANGIVQKSPVVTEYQSINNANVQNSTAIPMVYLQNDAYGVKPAQ